MVFTKYYSEYQIKLDKNHEMSRTCSIHRQNVKWIQNYIWTALRDKIMYEIQIREK
jgi:hypothetical protein